MEEKLDKLNMKMNILFKKISRIEDKLNEIGLNEILIEFSNFYFEKRLKNKNYYKSLEKHLSKYYSNDDKSDDSEIFSINSNKSKKKKMKKNKDDSEDSDKLKLVINRRIHFQKIAIYLELFIFSKKVSSF